MRWFQVLERKALEQWEKYTTSDIVEILRVLVDIKYDRIDANFLTMVSEWFAVNLNQVGLVVSAGENEGGPGE